MGRTSLRDARRAPRRRLAWLVLGLVRALAIVLSLQTTGVTSAGADVVGLALGIDVAHDDCAGDTGEPDEDCPPGCPSCHCPHLRVTVLPPVALADAPFPRDVARWGASTVGEVPPSAPRADLFRPPRVPPAPVA